MPTTSATGRCSRSRIWWSVNRRRRTPHRMKENGRAIAKRMVSSPQRSASAIFGVLCQATSRPLASEVLRTRLGEEAFEAALAQGRALSFPQMAALIGGVLDAAAQGDTSEKLPHEAGSTILSPREQDVLQLVAEGLTNKEIARRLIRSEYTIKAHVTSLFNKLGVDSRAQAVAVAAHRNLL